MNEFGKIPVLFGLWCTRIWIILVVAFTLLNAWTLFFADAKEFAAESSVTPDSSLSDKLLWLGAIASLSLMGLVQHRWLLWELRSRPDPKPKYYWIYLSVIVPIAMMIIVSVVMA